MCYYLVSPSFMVITPCDEKLLKHLSFRYYQYIWEHSLFLRAGADSCKLQSIEHYCLLSRGRSRFLNCPSLSGRRSANSNNFFFWVNNRTCDLFLALYMISRLLACFYIWRERDVAIHRNVIKTFQSIKSSCRIVQVISRKHNFSLSPNHQFTLAVFMLIHGTPV